MSEMIILVIMCWFDLKALVFFSFDWYFSWFSLNTLPMNQ